MFSGQAIRPGGQVSFPSHSLPGFEKAVGGPRSVAHPSTASGSQFLSKTIYHRYEINALCLLAIAPPLFACCVLLLRALRHVRYRPRWLERFVDEQSKGQNSPSGSNVKNNRSYLPSTLLVLSIFGLTSQVVAVFVEAHDLRPLPRALTWVSHAHPLPFQSTDTRPAGSDNPIDCP